MIKVITFGTFDILHKGHEFYLKEAKKLGNKLYVIVALDSTVLKMKGKLPRNGQEKRLSEIKKLPFVDEAILGNSGDKYKIIEKIKPDVICIGYDQNSFTDKLSDELTKRNISAKIIRLESFKPEIFKSSKMINKN